MTETPESGDPARWATWREIHAQPGIWRDWAATLDVAGLRDWIAGLGVDEVWFCGAGTSAFIGDIVVAGLEGVPGPTLRAVPTTDLVARPHAYLTGRRPLVVSFGRSGNSSESIGTLDALDALAPHAPRLHITCNADGTLAARTGGSETRVVLLPPATHDAGFAMTSSFSTMLLTALALFDASVAPLSIWDEANEGGYLHTLADALEAQLPTLPDAIGDAPARAVFVGSGPLAHAARECALKVMELAAGAIPAIWDSSLGFRHGPKSFVNDGTLIAVLTGPDDTHSAPYDTDLIAELRDQYPASRVLSIGPGGDVDIPMPLGPLWSAPLSIAVSQVAGVIWADAMDLDVDDPFAGRGTLSRVVSGVTLYPVAR